MSYVCIHQGIPPLLFSRLHIKLSGQILGQHIDAKHKNKEYHGNAEGLSVLRFGHTQIQLYRQSPAGFQDFMQESMPLLGSR